MELNPYMIWITSPVDPSGLFVLHIFPSLGQGTIVRETHYADEAVLEADLLAALPHTDYLPTFVRKGIADARENGLCDWRNVDMRLTDEGARRLGWIK